MKLVFASDSFKGSLTGADTVRLLTEAARSVFGPCEIVGLPVADGGEGTVDAVLGAAGGERVSVPVHDPLMRRIQAAYGMLDGGRAILEMAAASGLPLVEESLRDPRKTTTFGTGELLRHALDRGAREIYIGLGGSATNDGGTGCMQALGVRFLDREGKELAGTGENLGRIERIDTEGLDPRLRECTVTVLSDVTNPLCGENGAARVYAKQKGASPAVTEELEAGMLHYSEILRRDCGTDGAFPGAGAAGGLGAALKGFCGGVLKSGIETVLDLIRFDERLEGADLVVTGEGRTDGQSRFGKAVQGVARRARAKGVPAVCLSGSMGEGAMDLCEDGIESIMTAVSFPMTLDAAMQNAESLYRNAAERMFRLIRTGMKM